MELVILFTAFMAVIIYLRVRRADKNNFEYFMDVAGNLREKHEKVTDYLEEQRKAGLKS